TPERTVLVADDDPHIRMLLRGFLSAKPGLRVLEAANGIAAVEVLLREKIDLLVLDLNMPGMNGLEVASVLRGNPATRDLRIVMFTTEGDAYTRRKAMAQGINYYVTKPFNPVDFDRILSGLLGSLS
ncbi:MAG: response regulator, partial [Candidatus Wallbacteria bacterium]|nr:response regulator [Candidatus Wallbacteria bacterium]